MTLPPLDRIALRDEQAALALLAAVRENRAARRREEREAERRAERGYAPRDRNDEGGDES